MGAALDGSEFVQPESSGRGLAELPATVRQVLGDYVTQMTNAIGRRTGAPGILVVTASAKRAAEMIKPVRKILKAAHGRHIKKLFGKHLKLKDQIQKLKHDP